MRSRCWGLAAAVGLVLGLVLLPGGGPSALASEDHELSTFKVTLENLTRGQPLSPPAAATHRSGLHMFRVGQLATDQLAAIAQDGNEIPMFNLFNGALRVTQAVDVGRPLTPRGKVVGTFTDSVTFEIKARRGDRFSLATMLICTNDGFTGVDGLKLPEKGSVVSFTNGYDAGRENNTEKQIDIVEPCSVLGPVFLPGVHPSPNRDAQVATIPPEAIHHHPGITGVGDLSPALHGWTNPVARVTITRLTSHDEENG